MCPLRLRNERASIGVTSAGGHPHPQLIHPGAAWAGGGRKQRGWCGRARAQTPSPRAKGRAFHPDATEPRRPEPLKPCGSSLCPDAARRVDGVGETRLGTWPWGIDRHLPRRLTSTSTDNKSLPGAAYAVIPVGFPAPARARVTFPKERLSLRVPALLTLFSLSVRAQSEEEELELVSGVSVT